jgi:hypothetical protein
MRAPGPGPPATAPDSDGARGVTRKARAGPARPGMPGPGRHPVRGGLGRGSLGGIEARSGPVRVVAAGALAAEAARAEVAEAGAGGRGRRRLRRSGVGGLGAAGRKRGQGGDCRRVEARPARREAPP